MSEPGSTGASSSFRDFLHGLAGKPEMGDVKAILERLSAIPGVSASRQLQIQMLKAQEMALKGQLSFVQQMIEKLESSSKATAPVEEEVSESAGASAN